jgi:two-component system KDP operon response regulator KdpE
MRVLVVHPDAECQQRLVEKLRDRWSTTHILTAGTAKLVLQLLRTQRPDVVVLVTSQADSPVLDLVRDIRRFTDVPVLLLGRNGGETEQIRSLRLGADDYIVEPVSGALLAARIDAVLRRGGVTRGADDPPDFRSGALSMWFTRRLVSIGGVPIKLTPLEYRLLYHLVLKAGEVVPAQVLLDRVWGDQYGATTKYLKVFTHRVRTKLGRRPDLPSIETERRIGYRLVPARMS